MKCFGFAMVKNECDIIEQFVRVNLRLLDELHIIDDGSNDGTIDILNKLRSEGLKVTVYFHQQSDVQQQARLLTALLQMTAHTGWDYAFLLDADEFLIDSRSDLESDLEAHCATQFGLLQWKTFIPMQPSASTPSRQELAHYFLRRSERCQMSKVVVPRRLLSEELQISPGNHYAITKLSASTSHVALVSRLGHVPIRSIDQLINKAVIGSHMLSVKRNRLPGETTHWEIMANAIRAKNFQLTFHDLQQFAFGFPGAPIPIETDEIEHDGLRIEFRKAHYSDLAQINIAKNFDHFCKLIVGSYAEALNHKHAA